MVFEFIKSIFARKAKRRVEEILNRLERQRQLSVEFKGWVERYLSQISVAYTNKRRVMYIKGRFNYLAANNQVRSVATNLIHTQLGMLNEINRMLSKFLGEIESIYHTLNVSNKVVAKMIEKVMEALGCIEEYKNQLENQLAALADKALGKENKRLWDESEKIKKLKGILQILEISGNELEGEARAIRRVKLVFDNNAPLIQQKIDQITKTLAPHLYFTNGLIPLRKEEIRGKLNNYFRSEKDPVSKWKREFFQWLENLKKEVKEFDLLFYNIREELRGHGIPYSDFEKYYGDEIKPLEDKTNKLRELVRGSEKLEIGIGYFDPYKT